jgi:hypothetical protein
VELISRVTKVMGNLSATPATPRKRNGSFSVARGYSRWSGTTPMACVGTRANRRGIVGCSSGATRRAGVRAAATGADAAAAFARGLFALSNETERFVALMAPSEMRFIVTGPKKQKQI